MSAGSPREVFGPYLVYEQLGIGGMAEVHRAEVAGIEGFRRIVALKRMLPHVAGDKDLVQAFVREARLASHLRHTNVPQTYELGLIDGIYFIAMEYIAGPTLRDVLQHCGPTTGPVPVPVALNIINQLCDALDHAHNLTDETGVPLGIIHRDVSPSNVIVAPGGVVKLIDFGIAKIADTSMQTVSGTIKGKFGYMAPEYIGGRLDARADLFALGVIAHELLTNRPLFTGPDDMATLQRVQRMEIVPPSKMNKLVPREIDEIVMTALERDPDRRWQQASALRVAMTTLTKRLGMAIPDAQVVTWLDSAFDHTRPHALVGPRSQESQSISMLIEPPAPDPHPHVDPYPHLDPHPDHSDPDLAASHSDHTVEVALPPGAGVYARHSVQHPTASVHAGDLMRTVASPGRRSRPPVETSVAPVAPVRVPMGFPPPDVEGDEGHIPAIPDTIRGSGLPSGAAPAPAPAPRVLSLAGAPRVPPLAGAQVPIATRRSAGGIPRREMRPHPARPPEPPLRVGLLVTVMLIAAGVVAAIVYFVLSRII